MLPVTQDLLEIKEELVSGVTSPAHAHMQYSDDKMTSYRIGLTTTKGIVYR